jgi:hypothetical protein
MAIMGRERRPGVEAQSELSRHERIGHRARVDCGVLDNPRLLLQDG